MYFWEGFVTTQYKPTDESIIAPIMEPAFIPKRYMKGTTKIIKNKPTVSSLMRLIFFLQTLQTIILQS